MYLLWFYFEKYSGDREVVKILRSTHFSDKYQGKHRGPETIARCVGLERAAE